MVKPRGRERRLRLEPLEVRNLLAANPIISEFMASNSNTLFDGNGESSDWIEVFNDGDEPVNLAGYTLTDDFSNPTKWTFPSTILNPKDFVVVFASGSGIPDGGGNLHTNFKLSSSGEYLALVDPTGQRVSEFGDEQSTYPAQLSDASYGFAFQRNTNRVVDADSTARYLVPQNGSVDGQWFQSAFDDSQWTEGTASLGYELTSGFQDSIQTELPPGTTTAYVRIPFESEAGAQIDTFGVRYDDTFAAWLNGTLITNTTNFNPTQLNYQAIAPFSRGDIAAFTYANFNVSQFSDLLVTGTNVLAIQMLNTGPNDSDFLFVPLMDVTESIEVTGEPGVLVEPTPDDINSDIYAGNVSFSHDHGIYREPFQLTLAAESANDVIRYTLNGTTPNASSPVYTGPITINATTRVRAQAFSPSGDGGIVFWRGFTFADATVDSINSDLPIVVIEGHGQGHPGKDNFLDANLTLFEPDESGRTTLASEPTVSMGIGFHGRGSSTFGNPKPGLRIELRDERGEDQSMSLLGMPAESDWVLYAPYEFDRALLRNPFFYEVSRQMGHWAPRTRFVEVYGNLSRGSLGANDYLGVYVLVENIKRDEARVDIEKLTESDISGDDITGGYIFKIDRSDGEPGSSWTSSRGVGFVHVEPERADMPLAQANYLRSHINSFESVLYGNDWLDPDTGYRTLFDVEASIDHHLVRALAKDPDALRLSTFLTKDRNGKIAFGPVWDFDRTAGPDTDSRAFSPVGWDTNGSLFGYTWWSRLFDDPSFEQQWVDRWQELRQTTLSDENLSRIIDDLSVQVEESQVRNFERWPAVRPNGGPFSDVFRGGSWVNEVDHLKGWLIARAEWMDTQMVSPVAASQPSGTVASGTLVTLTNDTDETIYFTLDGQDPRNEDSSLNPLAQIYTEPIVVRGDVEVIARAFRGFRGTGATPVSPWSSALTASYNTSTAANIDNLRITELHFNPQDPNSAEQSLAPSSTGGDYEFVELTNVSDESISLFGVQFTRGIDFDFSTGNVTSLRAGESTVIVSNHDAFAARYPSVDTDQVAGQYVGSLNNGGERLTLLAADGSLIHDFFYDDANGWPAFADGDGPSLEIIDPDASFGLGGNWRASWTNHGTPGRIVGDFDGDAHLTCFDANLLSINAIIGTNDAKYDVDDDGSVNQTDLQFWVNALSRTVLGDINLDGHVDDADFEVWNQHRFTTAAAYCTGDINTDGIVDVSDFNLWSAAREAVLATATAVPLPVVEETFGSLDVDRDGQVTPRDALYVMNWLNDEASLQTERAANLTPAAPAIPAERLDTNRDGEISPMDALRIINAINEEFPDDGVQADKPLKDPAENAIEDPPKDELIGISFEEEDDEK